MRSMTTSGRIARTVVVVEAELLEHPRREVLDDDVARARPAASRASSPSGWPRSSVMPRLPRFDGVEQRRLLVELRVLVGPHRGAEADAVGPLHRLDLDHVGAHRARATRSRTGPAQNAVKSSTRDARERPLADRGRRRAARGARAATPARRSAAPGADELAVGDAVEAERRARPDPRLARLRDEHVALDEMVEPRQLGAVADDRRRAPAPRRTRRRPRRRCARRSSVQRARSPRRRA